MTSLKELKDKWFIDVSDEDAFPPQVRFPGSEIQSYADGNLVEPVIDGKAIMGDFHYRVQEMLDSDDPSQCQIMVGAMGIDPVKLLGENGPAKDAMTTMIEAAAAGVQVYFLGSGHPGSGTGTKAFAEKLIAVGGHGAADKRYAGVQGGHHQKFNVTRGPDGQWTALVSSADFFFARWDTPDHQPENPERPKKGGPTHDIGLKVRGPAVADVAMSFVERWNDPSGEATSPPITTEAPVDFLDPPIPEAGPHSVQVLRTFPIIKRKQGYSWSHQGEYTFWAAYLNAIKQARQYIYIEDQYIYAFHDPPYIETSNGVKRDTDFVYQLGEALKRGVDVVALAPGRNNVPWKHYELQQRQIASAYLREIAESNPNHGNFVISKLHIGGKDPTIHAKLLLVDDEYALIGSGNVCERSIAFITEMQLGVVDAENQFARDLRLDLWQEHLELDSPDSLLDPRAAVEQWHDNALSQAGRLRLLPSTKPSFKIPYRFLFNVIIDPYSGPDRRT
jgi:phosphatidylserine/phosphatidylglycerophosphate/cardiolipin synthase-like enzyme